MRLYDAMRALQDAVAAATAERQYTAALGRLSQLRPEVDAFFDAVMVKDENPQLRANRLACSRSCGDCSAVSPTCRACPVERARERAVAARRAPALQCLGSLVLHLLPVRVDLCLRDPLRHRLRRAALPAPLRAGASLRRQRAVGAEVELRAHLHGSKGEPLPAGTHVALFKHSSSWETIARMVVFPRQVWVLKRELLWIPVVGMGVRQMHAIAVDRKAGHSAVAQVVAQGKERLAEGNWVVIFPEGTRMAPGETRRYGISGALLAPETGRLLVPVAHDAGYFWPRRGLLKKPGSVRVVIGKPVSPAGRDVRAVNEEVQAWIEQTVRELQPR